MFESSNAARPGIITANVFAAIPAPPPPEAATIIATDGSQILPDRHAPFLYYLINIGGIQAFVSYITFMLWPIQDLARVYAELQNSVASAERIFSDKGFHQATMQEIAAEDEKVREKEQDPQDEDDDDRDDGGLWRFHNGPNGYGEPRA